MPRHALSTPDARKRSRARVHLRIGLFSLFLLTILLFTEVFGQWNLIAAVFAASAQNPNPTIATPGWLQTVTGAKPKDLGVYVKGKQNTQVIPIAHPSSATMAPVTLTVTPKAQHFVSPDTHLEITIPANTVSAQQVQAAGGTIHLKVVQTEGASGGAASGHLIFGSYQFQWHDAAGKALTTLALAQPLTIGYHLLSQQASLISKNQAMTAAWSNDTPAPITTTTPATKTAVKAATALATQATASTALTTKADHTGLSWSVSSLLNQNSTSTLANRLQAATTTATSAAAAASSTITFNTAAPEASWGTPTDFQTGLNSGALTYNYPLSVPPGPGGLAPSLSLNYSSGSVNETHNAQANASWVGEGWNLDLGSISWSQENVTPGGTNRLENVWNINDPSGISGQLIPPDLNAATSAPTFPAMSSLPAQYIWHTAPESHAKVQEVNFNGIPCWHVWLPNGTMEEFGCTDPSRQSSQDASGALNPYRWNLDLMVDRNGNQIRVNYQRLYNPATGIVRDGVVSSIEYDDPTCHNTSFNGATAACSSWNPQVRIVFDANTQVANLTNGGAPGNCGDWNNSTSMRCDNPIDLTGSGGLGIAKSMNTYVLNDVQIQVQGNLLHKYVLSYEQTHSYAETDPLSGLQESVAGALDLTRIQEQGTNGTTLNAPVVNVSYQNHVERYEDLYHHAKPSNNCGTSWAPRDGSGCYLWEQSYSSNYISTLDNGRGWHENITWGEAHANTHGVDSGATNDVYTCNGQQAATNLCSQADDGAWSRIVVQSRQAVTNGVTSTWNYRYYVRQGWPSPPCANCLQGYTWGNINDNDFADYYNTIFTSFASAEVTNPDGSYQIETFYSSDGVGLASSSITCYSSAGCHPAPYSNPNPGLAGQAQQIQNYGSDGKLQTVNNTTYTVNCPPAGVGHSGNANGPPKDIGNSELSSELDANNPVVVCDLRVTQQDSYQVEGVTDINGYLNDARVLHKQTNTTYDSDNQGTNGIAGYDYGNVSRVDVTGNDVNNQHYIAATTYYPNDNVGSGIYLTDLPANIFTLDANGNTYNCTAATYGSNTATNQSPIIPQVTSSNAFMTDGGCKGPSINVFNTYNASGNPLGEIDADGHLGCTIGLNTYSMCSSYDASATHMIGITNAKNQITTTNYDTNAAGGFGQWKTSDVDVNGQTTSYQYDALGRVIAEISPGDSVSSPTVTYSYNNTCTNGSTNPCLETSTTARVNSGSTTTSKKYYDGMGRLVETIGPGATLFSKVPAIPSLIVSYTLYDNMGRAITTSLPYAIASTSGIPGSNGYVTPDQTQPRSVTKYDGIGRPLGSITYSNASTITISNNISYAVALGVPGMNVDTTTAFATSTTTDAYSHQETGFIDALGHLRYEQKYSGTGTLNNPYIPLRTVQYNYNATGKTTSALTYDQNAHQIAYTNTTYDGLGRVTGWNDADNGSCAIMPLPAGCQSSSDTAWKVTYDAESNVISQTDPRGVATYTSYDNLNRILCSGTSLASVNPCQNTAYNLFFYDSYDNSSNPSASFPMGCTASDGSALNNSIGASVASVFTSTAGSGWRCSSYDAKGQVLSNTLSVTADSHTTTQTVASGYNDGGDVTNLTYPDGEVVAATYDNNGYFRGSSTANGPITSNIQYTKTGQIANMTVGGLIFQGVATTPVQTNITYDGVQRPVTTGATVKGQIVFSQTRTYDNVGNVLQLQTTIPTTSGSSQTDSQSFCYDEQNRLVWAGNTGTPTGGDHCGLAPSGTTITPYQQMFSYDALDRFISGPAGTNTYDPNHVHAATSVSQFPNQYASYDAMGDMTCRNVDQTTNHSCGSAQTGTTMTYDNEGRLATWTAPNGKVESDQFLYDTSGNRVLQRVSTSSGVTDTITFDNYTETTISGSVSSTIKYYNAAGHSIAMANGNTFNYLLSDVLNSSNVTLKSDGTPQSVQLFVPFGSTRYSDGSSPTTYNFTGQRLDTETGLLYYNARYYDPVSGYFTSTDTVATNNQGMNPYAYVDENPETKNDPSGLCGVSSWGDFGDCFSKTGATIQSVAQSDSNFVQDVVHGDTYGIVANDYDFFVNPWRIWHNETPLTQQQTETQITKTVVKAVPRWVWVAVVGVAVGVGIIHVAAKQKGKGGTAIPHQIKRIQSQGEKHWKNEENVKRQVRDNTNYGGAWLQFGSESKDQPFVQSSEVSSGTFTSPGAAPGHTEQQAVEWAIKQINAHEGSFNAVVLNIYTYQDPCDKGPNCQAAYTTGAWKQQIADKTNIAVGNIHIVIYTSSGNSKGSAISQWQP